MSSITETDADVALQKVRKSYYSMMFYSIGIVLFSVAIAQLFNIFCPLSSFWIMALECAGYVCWGTTLGSLGTKIFPPYGQTPAELLDQKLASLFSILGIITFTMARALEPAIS